MEPIVLRVTRRVRVCGRLLHPEDRIAVYPGYGVYPILEAPPNYGAIAGAMADGALEPVTPSLSRHAFAAAVGLEARSPSLASALGRPSARWGARLHRERAGLRLEP